MSQLTSNGGAFARLERLASEVPAMIAAVNDHGDRPTIDQWALLVATARLERDLDAVLVILKAAER